MGDIWFDANHLEAWLGGQPVIHDLCLKLKIGESTTILGPNGAGKSTIVNLINRSLYPIVKPRFSSGDFWNEHHQYLGTTLLYWDR